MCSGEIRGLVLEIGPCLYLGVSSKTCIFCKEIRNYKAVKIKKENCRVLFYFFYQSRLSKDCVNVGKILELLNCCIY